MVDIPGDASQIRCEGCRELFNSYPHMLNHRRGKNSNCKGSLWTIVVPDDLLGTSPSRETTAPPKADGAAATAEAEASTEGRGLPVKEPAADGRGAGGATVVMPSTVKETLWFPASYRALFDGFRAVYGFEGSFNDFVLQMIDDHCRLMRITPAIIVGHPPGHGEVLEYATASR